MAAKKPDHPEPYCMRCYSRFSKKKIPYMVNCCHLYCSKCVFGLLNSTCVHCPLLQGGSGQKITDFSPAYDVWDLIETRRHFVSSPIRWITVKKTNVVCLNLRAGKCLIDKCPFIHFLGAADAFRAKIINLDIGNPPTLTSAGWLCRCDLEHDYGATCEYCWQKFDLS